jgi:hypothetical protein
MILKAENILETISYICSKESSFNKLIKANEEIRKELEEYKDNKKNSNKIFNYFYKKILNNPIVINGYIENSIDFINYIESNQKDREEKVINDLLTLSNENNINFIVELLLKNENTCKDLIKKHYKIKAEVISYKKDNNYESRNKIGKYFLNLIKKNDADLRKYIENNYESIIKEFKNLKKIENKNNNISGKVYIIRNNIDAWEKFSRSVSNKTFRSFSVVENDDKLEIYFL